MSLGQFEQSSKIKTIMIILLSIIMPVASIFVSYLIITAENLDPQDSEASFQYRNEDRGYLEYITTYQGYGINIGKEANEINTALEVVRHNGEDEWLVRIEEVGTELDSRSGYIGNYSGSGEFNHGVYPAQSTVLGGEISGTNSFSFPTSYEGTPLPKVSGLIVGIEEIGNSKKTINIVETALPFDQEIINGSFIGMDELPDKQYINKIPCYNQDIFCKPIGTTTPIVIQEESEIVAYSNFIFYDSKSISYLPVKVDYQDGVGYMDFGEVKQIYSINPTEKEIQSAALSQDTQGDYIGMAVAERTSNANEIKRVKQRIIEEINGGTTLLTLGDRSEASFGVGTNHTVMDTAVDPSNGVVYYLGNGDFVPVNDTSSGKAEFVMPGTDNDNALDFLMLANNDQYNVYERNATIVGDKLYFASGKNESKGFYECPSKESVDYSYSLGTCFFYPLRNEEVILNMRSFKDDLYMEIFSLEDAQNGLDGNSQASLFKFNKSYSGRNPTITQGEQPTATDTPTNVPNSPTEEPTPTSDTQTEIGRRPMVASELTRHTCYLDSINQIDITNNCSRAPSDLRTTDNAGNELRIAGYDLKFFNKDLEIHSTVPDVYRSNVVLESFLSDVETNSSGQEIQYRRYRLCEFEPSTGSFVQCGETASTEVTELVNSDRQNPTFFDSYSSYDFTVQDGGAYPNATGNYSVMSYVSTNHTDLVTHVCKYKNHPSTITNINDKKQIEEIYDFESCFVSTFDMTSLTEQVSAFTGYSAFISNIPEIINVRPDEFTNLIGESELVQVFTTGSTENQRVLQRVCNITYGINQNNGYLNLQSKDTDGDGAGDDCSELTDITLKLEEKGIWDSKSSAFLSTLSPYEIRASVESEETQKAIRIYTFK